MKRGAFDYLLKPVDFPPAARGGQGRRWNWAGLRHVPAVIDPATDDDGPAPGGRGRPDRGPFACHAGGVQGHWPGGARAMDVTVLVTGESGTGKELVVRGAVLPQRPGRRTIFLALNCAAIPETAAGKRAVRPRARGPSPGADHRRIGKFEQANGGNPVPGRDRRHEPRHPVQGAAVVTGNSALSAWGGNENHSDRRSA